MRRPGTGSVRLVTDASAARLAPNAKRALASGESGRGWGIEGWVSGFSEERLWLNLEYGEARVVPESEDGSARVVTVVSRSLVEESEMCRDEYRGCFFWPREAVEAEERVEAVDDLRFWSPVSTADDVGGSRGKALAVFSESV